MRSTTNHSLSKTFTPQDGNFEMASGKSPLAQLTGWRKPDVGKQSGAWKRQFVMRKGTSTIPAKLKPTNFRVNFLLCLLFWFSWLDNLMETVFFFCGFIFTLYFMKQWSYDNIWDMRKLYLYHLQWWDFLLLRHHCNVLQHNYSCLIGTTSSKNNW